MASGLSCPDCGSDNVLEDDLYSQRQLVCADCGSVVSEGQLTTTRSEELQGTVVHYYESTEVTKYPCKNQIKGLKRVRALCRILRFPTVIEESAESLFSRAYQHARFLHVSLQKKEALAGGSVLLACRLHGVAITMGTVTTLMEVDPSLVGTVYKAMVKALQVEVPSCSIFDLLEGHCNEYHLSSLDVPEEYCESAGRLAERASALLELASTTWLVTGRHPVPTLMASVYLAWLSLKPCVARLRVSLSRFCKVAKVPVPRPAAKRVAELQEVLCRLGRELPWQQVTPIVPGKVACVVEDILKHRLTLLKRSVQRYEDELDKELSRNTKALPTDHAPCNEAPPTGCSLKTGAPPSDPAASTEGLATKSSPCFSGQSACHQIQKSGNILQVVSEPLADQQVSSLENTDPEEEMVHGRAQHQGKRHLFTPPCRSGPFPCPSKQMRLAEPVVAVTGDEEISDSEIDGYIRTPLEVRELLESQLELGLR